jgi:Tfp pilus assembly protein PilF
VRRTGFIIGLACLIASTTTADGARRQRSRQVVEEPPLWETPGGRDAARLEFAQALLAAGSADACLELIAQLRQDGVRGLNLERLHADALRATGLDDDAQTILESIVKKWPRDAPSHNALGILAMDRQELDVAVKHFEQAVRHDDKNAHYLNNLGFSLMVSDQPDAAIDVLRTALRANSANPQTRNNLGFALVAADRLDEAWRVFKATSRSPADAHYNVGVGLELRGEQDDASAAYKRALDADPTHVAARDALARLDTLQAPPASPDITESTSPPSPLSEP